MQNRPNLDNYYLNIAMAVSMRSTCLKKHYGAVIVNNNIIIATGYNGAPRGEEHCTRCTKICNTKDESAYSLCISCHAEMNAIISASRKEMLGSTLYLAGCSVEGQEEECGIPIDAYPCEICLRLIKNAGIDKIINRTGIIYKRNSEGVLEKCNK